MNSYLESIANGIGPETKKVIIARDVFIEMLKEDVLYREPGSITTVLGIPLEVDQNEIAIRFE